MESNENALKKFSIRKIIALIFWLAQCAAEVVTIYMIMDLGLIPSKYVAALGAVFAVLTILTGCLFFVSGKRKKPGIVKTVIAALLSICIIASSSYASFALSKINRTVKTVTDTKDTAVTDMVGVYVLKDDKAETISDAKNYTFALLKNKNGSSAVSSIKKETGGSIKAKKYDSTEAAVKALYDKKKQALIMNEAYVSILEETEDYAGFSDKTKLLYETEISKDDTQQNTETAPEKDITTKPFLLYLSGSDTRSKMLTTSRSDVNILAAVNPVTKQILLLNTPRDYYIPNPAGNGAVDKLTHCGIYGIDCSIEALEDLYDEKIDYYAQINFTGFETLIDDIGGVTIYSDTSFNTSRGTSIQKGNNELNGKEALILARERYNLPNGDNDRGQNQMKVLKAVMQKIAGGALLSNYSDVLSDLEGMFITDISTEEIAAVVKMQLSDMAEWNIVSYAVGGTGGRASTYSMPNSSLYVMYPDYDTVNHAVKLINQVMDGKTIKE